MKTILIMMLGALLLASVATAQTATVLFDAATGTTAATANSWTSVLYVNGVAFPMVQTCTGTTLVTCQAPSPNITAALTPLGTQTFEVTFKDVILGESPRSGPFARIRPAAPSNLRIQ